MNTDQKIKAINSLLQLSKNTEEQEALLSDLLTESEIKKIYERVLIFDCLERKLSQRETAKKTTAAIATVTRGAAMMKKPELAITNIIKEARKFSWWRPLFWSA